MEVDAVDGFAGRRTLEALGATRLRDGLWPPTTWLARGGRLRRRPRAGCAGSRQQKSLHDVVRALHRDDEAAADEAHDESGKRASGLRSVRSQRRARPTLAAVEATGKPYLRALQGSGSSAMRTPLRAHRSRGSSASKPRLVRRRSVKMRSSTSRRAILSGACTSPMRRPNRMLVKALKAPLTMRRPPTACVCGESQRLPTIASTLGSRSRRSNSARIVTGSISPSRLRNAIADSVAPAKPAR